MASLKDLIVMGPARFLDKLYGNLEGNATSATKLQTPRAINGTNFDGTTAITTANWGTARNIYIQDSDGSNTGAAVSVNGGANATLKLPATIKASLSGNASTATTATYALKMQTYKYNSTQTYGTSYPLYAQWNQQGNVLLLKCDNYTVNTDTATKLATARTINGTNFDGSAAITTANWGTARTLTIGNTGKSVNGSSNVSWSLAEIGAVPKIEGNANVAYPVYRALGNIYKGSAAVSYYRIALPQATSWGMFMMKLAVRESYSTGSAGEIIIYANHSSSADWNQFFATCVGNLSTNIKVYGSDKKYFYIGGSFSYGGLSIELMTVGDTASTINLSNVVIDTVTALPSTYQTATMCYSLHSNNYTTHLDSRYVTLATEQTITAAKTLTSNWSFKTTNYTSTPIQLLDDSTTYGHTMLIGAGGTTYIGAGESASTLYSKLAVKSTEDLILGADSSIRFHTGADSATTTSGITLNTSNQLYPQTNNTGSLGTSSYKWGSIYSNKGYFGGTSTTDYALNTSSFICDSWIRTKGATGWYNEDYGGGWHMNDTIWIRAYNDKKVYVSNAASNAIMTEGGVAATSIESRGGYPIFRLADDISMSSLGTSAAIEEYIKLYIKSICSKYPGKHGVFRGKCSPNSVAYVEVYIYDTSTVNSTTGLPQYCFGTWRQYTNTFYKFWTADYTFGLTAIVDSSNFSSILDSYYDSRYLKLSGGTMTGALNLKNGTWNKAGDDAQFGDNNTAGSFAIQGLNGTTNLKLVKYGDSNSYATISWDGTYITSSGHLALPASKHFYMTYNNTKHSVLYNHDNGNVSLRACGGGLFIGYGDTTTGIHFGPSGNWGSISSSGYSGNAATATKLQTARTIFGQSFNGTANVAGQVDCYGSYTASANQRYYYSALEIRENGLVGSAQSDIGYAPSIGFHWANRTAATLNYHSDGIFYFRKQDGTSRATIDANVNGWASSAGSASTATYLVEDESFNLSRHSFQYFNISGTAGAAVSTNDTPTTAWWHIQRHTHANSAGYYTDVAIPFNDNQIYYKRVSSGSLVNGGWVMLYDTKSIIYSSTEPTSGLKAGMIWLKPV